MMSILLLALVCGLFTLVMIALVIILIVRNQ